MIGADVEPLSKEPTYAEAVAAKPAAHLHRRVKELCLHLLQSCVAAVLCGELR